MPTTYKGLTVPLSSDLADGPAAFRDYTDSLPQGDLFDTILVPIGTVVPTVRTSAPANWLLLNGLTIAGGQTLYPELWAIVPASWQSGVDLVLPNAAGRLLVGVDPATPAIDAVGEMTGAKTVVLVAANLPPHAHVQQGNTGGASARHRHGASGGGQFVETAFAAGLQLPGGAGAVGATLTNTDTPDHVHALSGNTGNGPGTSTPVSIMPPVIAFNYMIRASI